MGRIEFPVYWDDPSSFENRGRRAIELIDPDAQKIIADIQPFHRGDDYASSPLYRLHELNNRDKHRALLVSVLQGAVSDLTVTGILTMHMGGGLLTPSPPAAQRLDNDSVIGFIPMVPGMPPDPSQMNTDIALMLDIALDEPGFPLMEWSGFFQETWAWLVDHVFRPLVPFLSQT